MYLLTLAFTFWQEITNDLYKIVKSFKQLERLFIYDQFHDFALTREVILQYARSFWNRCGTLRKIGFYVCDPYLMVEKTVSMLKICFQRGNLSGYHLSDQNDRQSEDSSVGRSIVIITLNLSQELFNSLFPKFSAKAFL